MGKSQAQTSLLIGGIFGGVGLLLLGIGTALAASTMDFMSSAERTVGTVTGLTLETSRSSDSGESSAWYPTVRYVVDGRTYSFKSSTGSNPAAYQVGDTAEVAYDPDVPSDGRLASVGDAYLAPLILGGMGIVFTPIGVVCLVHAHRVTRLRRWLLEHGREVWAPIAEVARTFSGDSSNRRVRYVVYATWEDEQTGRTHTAASDYLDRDPGPQLEGRTHIRVRYDPADPERNLLDSTSF